ncbi:MAG: T9SS type A sorting domain-containing protein [Cyclobacteriaceae bacterium]|nr:T9SS type A sorting domain-containing protein [Cyclobacteriaceae bacterium]
MKLVFTHFFLLTWILAYSQKLDQSITFHPIPTQFLGQQPFLLKAETNAQGLIVSYTSSNPEVATIEGNLLIIQGTGSTLITATQLGNAFYNPANPIVQTLKVEDLNTQPRLLGASFGGGTDCCGTVFSIDSSTGDKLLNHYSFERDLHPVGGILKASDGSLYGASMAGGKNNIGVIYQYSFHYNRLVKIFEFSIESGYMPVGNLFESLDNEIIGVTSKGGDYDQGTIFKIKKDGTGFKKLFDFTGQYGESPGGGLIECSNGFYYGTTRKGGFYGNGIIYRISKDGNEFYRLHSFTGENGAEPSELLEATNGRIYGGTNSGGNLSYGLIYSLKLDGSDFQIVHRPEINDYHDGIWFGSKFIKTSDGHILGTASSGGIYGMGVLFRINPSENSYEKIFTFGDLFSGGGPTSSLLSLPNGKIIGNTLTGGIHNSGTIYEIDQNGGNYKTLYEFDPTEAKNPNQFMALDEHLALYGSSNLGGPNNGGSIFKFEVANNQFSILHSACLNGCLPTSAPIMTEAGDIYGATQRGGRFGGGVVYKISKNGRFQRLVEFSSANGASPNSPTILYGSDRHIYGMTSSGGTQSSGVIYRVNTNSDDFETIHEFANVVNGGAHPYTGLMEASDGKLYGTTTYGGQIGGGVIFKIDKNGTGFTVLKNLSMESGINPYGSLIEGSDGFLYGTTSGGGINNVGVIFKISKSGNEFTKLHDFSLSNGTSPSTALSEIRNGVLMGVTEMGGTFNGGTIFSIHSNGSNFQVLHNFSLNTGTNPTSPLIQLTYGEFLFGVTRNGGSSNYTQGLIYRIRKDATGYSVFHSFGNISNPIGLSLINQQLITSIHNESSITDDIEIFPNPSNSNFTINIGSIRNANTEFICMDLLGRVVFHKLVKTNDVIEFGNTFQAGLYIVLIRTEQQSKSKLILKQ